MPGRRLTAATCAAIVAACAATPVAHGDTKTPVPIGPNPPASSRSHASQPRSGVLGFTESGHGTTVTGGELPLTGGSPDLVALAGLGLLLTGAGLRLRVRES